MEPGKMSIEDILIFVLLIAIILASINLYTYWKKRKNDEAKKRLSRLYYPLHSILAKKNKYVLPLKTAPHESFETFAIEYYKIFLELQKRYLDNQICETGRLSTAFTALMESNGMEICNDNRESHLPDEVIRNLALFELKYRVDEDGLSQIERNMQAVEEAVESDISKMVKRGLATARPGRRKNSSNK